MKVIKTDLAIMGSGLAGLSAAVRARRAGIEVAVFEKRPFQGGSISNCPMMVMAVRPEKEYQEKAFKVHMNYTNWGGNAAAVRSWFKYSSQIPSFVAEELGLPWGGIQPMELEDLGVKPGYGVCFPAGINVGDYYYPHPIGKGHGAAVVCKKMADILRREGGQIYFSTPIQKLLKEDGKIVGAMAYDRKAEEEVKVEAKAVFIASGGFHNDPKMLKDALGIDWVEGDPRTGSNAVFTPFPNAQMTGDGMKIAWEVGAAKGKLGIGVGTHPVRTGIVGKNCPWVTVTNLMGVLEQPYLHVNRRGKRVFCEDMADVHGVKYTTAMMQPGKDLFIIFDDETRERLETRGVENAYFIFPDPILHDVRGMFEKAISMGNDGLFMADSLEELARKAGIDEDGLKETVERYNGFCDAGYDDDFFTSPQYLRPVRKPTYYCMRCVPAGYHAIGGLRITGKCEVVDDEARPIPGLYAGGDVCAADLFGDPNLGGEGYWTISMSQGLICGDTAVEYIKK